MKLDWTLGARSNGRNKKTETGTIIALLPLIATAIKDQLFSPNAKAQFNTEKNGRDSLRGSRYELELKQSHVTMISYTLRKLYNLELHVGVSDILESRTE